jgi:Uma2 family endonuclease
LRSTGRRWYAGSVIARVPLIASDAELLRISAENPGWRIERDAMGALIVTPPTGAASSNRNVRVTHMLHEWAEAYGYIAFDSSGGFRLPDTSVVAPNGSLVLNEAWAELGAKERERFFPGVPAVAIELCSLTDNPADLRAKLERLRRAGSSYVVLMDPYHGDVWTDGVAPPAFDLDFTELLETD